ncbi:uncharacterized protein LOC107265527 isoform X2 [Cephus cinctus]|uniref:Uncharacterized protein LOC107265527 isoform X2 n=1 Tax=Cephus cinctus TaxID=211228 RepID=A0AAJ7RDQ4_CEPCN|nr:uncharacterized protein LOC107265527 isoform X2 [Cephus cinctus]
MVLRLRISAHHGSLTIPQSTLTTIQHQVRSSFAIKPSSSSFGCPTQVLRTQPEDIYCFVADYVDALLITRENAKVAVKVVNNVVLGSESIVAILQSTGLKLDGIALASKRIQKAFQVYLELMETPNEQTRKETIFEEQSRLSISNILESTGTSRDQAIEAATRIQAAFRGHYERLRMGELRGEIQWQRAASNTLEILRKAGVSKEEATNAAILIQSTYRGYYTRRNMKMKLDGRYEENRKNKKNKTSEEFGETIQTVTWINMMHENSGVTVDKANQAATVIQAFFRGYRVRRDSKNIKNSVTSDSNMVNDILDNIRQRVFDSVMSRGNIPKKFGSHEEVKDIADKIQNDIKERFSKESISKAQNKKKSIMIVED